MRLLFALVIWLGMSFCLLADQATDLAVMQNKVLNDMVLTPQDKAALEQFTQTMQSASDQALCSTIEKQNQHNEMLYLQEIKAFLDAKQSLTPRQNDAYLCICTNPSPANTQLCQELSTLVQQVPVAVETNKPAPAQDIPKLPYMQKPQWQSPNPSYYSDDPISNQTFAEFKNGFKKYPPDMSIFKQINQKIFAAHPERYKNAMRLFRENKCPGCDLRGIQFKGGWFYKREADGKYSPVDLRYAQLDECNFDSARIAGGDFRGATAKNSTWNFAAMSGANFEGVDFSRDKPLPNKLIMNQGRETKEYLETFEKNRTTFGQPTAVRAIFDGCDFTNVDFANALLMGSSFKNAKFDNAAFIFQTDLSNVTFLGATNLMQDRWKEAKRYFCSKATLDSRRESKITTAQGTAHQVPAGEGREVVDRFVKFFNTEFPDGTIFTGQYGTNEQAKRIKNIDNKERGATIRCENQLDSPLFIS